MQNVLRKSVDYGVWVASVTLYVEWSADLRVKIWNFVVIYKDFICL